MSSSVRHSLHAGLVHADAFDLQCRTDVEERKVREGSASTVCPCMNEKRPDAKPTSLSGVLQFDVSGRTSHADKSRADMTDAGSGSDDRACASGSAIVLKPAISSAVASRNAYRHRRQSLRA